MMIDEAMTIGDVARRSGTKVPTVRWYEQHGLLPEPARTAGNQRRYTNRHLGRLLFIRRGRELGFSLDAIRTLLTLAGHDEAPCERADELAREHLQDVEEKIARLTALRAELEKMVGCERRTVSGCRVIDALSGQDPQEH